MVTDIGYDGGVVRKHNTKDLGGSSYIANLLKHAQ